MSDRIHPWRPIMFSSLIWSLAAAVHAYTPVPPPAWASETGHVWHVYLFPTNSVNPSPDQSDNPFGAPAALVTLGPFSAGWQDPKDPSASSGEPGSGAWDLGQGPAGSVRVTVPIGNAPGGGTFNGYRVRFQVNVVGLTGPFPPVALPSLAAEGYSLSDVTQTDQVAYTTNLCVWKHRTWSGQITNVMENAVTFIIQASSSGSVIDTIDIHAIADPLPPVVTALGTPLAWFQSFGITPHEGDSWNDADYYDSDHDGMLNWQEYVAGTKPNDPQSVFRILTVRGAIGQPPYLEWIGGTSGPTAPYLIESTLSLRNPDWQPAGTRERAEGLNTWTGSAPLEARRFYRIVATPDAK